MWEGSDTLIKWLWHLEQGHKQQNVQELSESKCAINRSQNFCLRERLIEVKDNGRSLCENVFHSRDNNAIKILMSCSGGALELNF